MFCCFGFSVHDLSKLDLESTRSLIMSVLSVDKCFFTQAVYDSYGYFMKDILGMCLLSVLSLPDIIVVKNLFQTGLQLYYYTC